MFSNHVQLRFSFLLIVLLLTTCFCKSNNFSNYHHNYGDLISDPITTSPSVLFVMLEIESSMIGATCALMHVFYMQTTSPISALLVHGGMYDHLFGHRFWCMTGSSNWSAQSPINFEPFQDFLFPDLILVCVFWSLFSYYEWRENQRDSS